MITDKFSYQRSKIEDRCLHIPKKVSSKHCHPEINQRAAEALTQIDVVGVGSNELEAQLAEKICHYVPSAEKVLFCNSGSEATYAALRLARAVTGRNKIIKFQGCYHGWHDAILMNVISPAEKIGQKDPLSTGMLPQAVENTLVLPFNDLEPVRQMLQEQGSEIAAIILELIPHNIGCVLPRPEFVQGLRKLATQHSAVLIFDEVITGFRHGLGGYQNYTRSDYNGKSYCQWLSSGSSSGSGRFTGAL
jgi:glutamate-1-semialdehyde 2,1-aminomutase